MHVLPRILSHPSAIGIMLLSLLSPGVSFASTQFRIPSDEEASRVNNDTVGVVFTHEELFHQAVHNMEDELEPYDGLRIVPIMGKNHVQSLYDLLYLKGVDLALVRADALEYLERKEGNDVINKVIRNVTRISSEKITIFAQEEIESIEDLAGKRIGLGLAGAGEFVTGSVVFDMLGIDAEFVQMNIGEASQELKEGELDALVYLLREPDAVMSTADVDAAKRVYSLKSTDGLHLLPLAENAQLMTIYTPSELGADELPGMIAEGESISTYSVDAILAAYRWNSNNPRHKKVERFVSAFVNGLDGLKSGSYEPLWSRVSLDNETPGIERLDMVDVALAERELAAAAAREKTIAAREARIEKRRADKLAKLEEQKETLSQKLRERVGDADSDELEALLEKVNGFMSELDSQASDAESEPATQSDTTAASDGVTTN